MTPCSQPNCPYTADDQCGMPGCPGRFRRAATHSQPGGVMYPPTVNQGGSRWLRSPHTLPVNFPGASVPGPFQRTNYMETI